MPFDDDDEQDEDDGDEDDQDKDEDQRQNQVLDRHHCEGDQDGDAADTFDE